MLSGSKNFRAVKQYKAADGRRIRANTIYRSGELSRLDEADLETLAGLNIQLVCDLRTEREQAKYTSRWPDGGLHRFLDLPGREQSDAGAPKLFELVAAHKGSDGGRIAMDRIYRRKPTVLAPALRVLFGAILAGDALPVLIHCHAGKDRTGFITAMLLSACGVSWPDILDDYVTTAQFFLPAREGVFFAKWAREASGLELDPALLTPLVDAHPEYLAAAFEEMTNGWGSVEDYLRKEINLTRDSQAELQSLLLV